MLLVIGTSAKVQLVTSVACSLDVHTSLVDVSSSNIVSESTKNTAITTATTTDVTGSPASGATRNVKVLNACNKGAANVGVTVQHTDGTTTVQLYTATLNPGQSLLYITGVGWFLVPVATPISLAVSVFCGDGSDGTATCDGATAVAGMSRSGSTYTMTRDVYFSALTVNAGVTVIAGGFRLFVAGTLTIAATGLIHNNGGAASGGVGGSGGLGATGSGTGGFYAPGSAGGSTVGAQPPSGANYYYTCGGTGGAGAYSAGVAVAPPAGFGGIPRSVGMMDSLFQPLSASFVALAANSHGGGTGGGGSATGQGGGGGGGVVAIFAKSIVNNGAIQARGGAGASETGSNANSGGGGGGFVFLAYTSLSGSGTIDANGGAKGTGGSGAAGNNGSNGNVVQVAAV